MNSMFTYSEKKTTKPFKITQWQTPIQLGYFDYLSYTSRRTLIVNLFPVITSRSLRWNSMLFNTETPRYC